MLNVLMESLSGWTTKAVYSNIMFERFKFEAKVSRNIFIETVPNLCYEKSWMSNLTERTPDSASKSFKVLEKEPEIEKIFHLLLRK